MRDSLRALLILLMLAVFIAGLLVCYYPMIWGTYVDSSIRSTAESFLTEQDTEVPTQSEVEVQETMPQEIPHRKLWEAMCRYNDTIAHQGQTGLSCAYAYQVPSFQLMDYGLDSEVFGVLEIPAMELTMPIFLGATNQHMADGAAHMSQTSLPIGGENTNCVIAGHRGYNGASYFRYIEKLQPGDAVTVTNLWETINYQVIGTSIIDPDDVDAILIQPGRELLTLLTCHPYASGGRQRYLVFCERIKGGM